jgi:transposase InsO family protein
MSQPMLPKTPVTVSAEALFRYQLVSGVRAKELAGVERADAVVDVAQTSHVTGGGTLRSVSPRTLRRWLRAFDAGGIAALEPRARPHVEVSAALPEAFTDFLRAEKRTDPLASVPELIRRAHEHGVIAADQSIDRVTVYRACVRMELPMTRRAHKREADQRRFAYPHRMMMMLCDGKHFRAGVRRTRRVALFFLDDATRLGLHVVVGASESTELFVRGLYEVIRRYGLMSIAFLDRGPGFISNDTHAVFAHLDTALVLGAARYPEGHGKIEKFHQIAWSGVLRSLVGAVDIDDTFGSLELRLGHFLSQQYNHWPHESLAGRSPAERFDTDVRPLRMPESEHDLRERFVLTETRKVSADNIVKHAGTLYELPRGYAGTEISVRRQVLDDSLSILHQGRLVRLHPVDLARNAIERRARLHADTEPTDTVPVTAATLAFRRAFGPVTGPDGGVPPLPDRSNKED